MTSFTIDVSRHNYDRGDINWSSVRGAGIEIAISAASEGDLAGYHYSNPDYLHAVTSARQAGIRLMGGYHALSAGDQSSINRQVDYLIERANVIGGVTSGWWMIDVEPFPELTSRGIAPRISDVFAFEARWHQVTNGYPLAIYLPHWYWQNLGSPDLSRLMGPLVSSNYPVTATAPFLNLYSRDGGDSGPGWAAYGNKAPKLWQFCSSAAVPGVVGPCDVNAFKGTIEEFINIVTTANFVSTTPPPIPPGGDPIMSALPMIRQGATGYNVKIAQAALNVNGGGLVVDGVFGPKTNSATLAFQNSHGLVKDGIIGPKTWSVLLVGHVI